LLIARIRSALADLGAKPTAIEREAGLSDSFLRKILAGQRPPRLRRDGNQVLAGDDPRYHRLAAALRIPRGEFVRLVEAAQKVEKPPAPQHIDSLQTGLAHQLLDLTDDYPDEIGAISDMALAFADAAASPVLFDRLKREIDGLPPVNRHAPVPPRRQSGRRKFGGSRPRHTRPLRREARVLHRLGLMSMAVEGGVPLKLRKDLMRVFMTLATRDFGSWDQAGALAAPR